MHAVDDRLDFAPPEPPGLLRALVLAVLAHLLLVAALTVGLRWQTETPNVVAEAELWASLPQQAAPKEVPVVPPPPPPPPPPLPVVRAPPLPDPQLAREAEIALERDKQKREAEQRAAAERRQAELEKERDRKRKLEAQRKKEEEVARKQEQQRLLAETKRKDDEKKRKLQEQEARDAKRLAQIREENMRRMQGMAGGGSPGSSGSAAQSAGPSASWGGRVKARVRPNIVFTGVTSTRWVTEVEVRLAPDGTIVSRAISKKSGSPAWDEAVLRALDKTEVLPRDTDGRVPAHGTLVFSPEP